MAIAYLALFILGAAHATGRACDEKGCRSIELIIFVPLHPVLEGLQPCVKFGL